MYQYKFRPGYGNKNLLIEFHNGPEKKEFLDDLFDVFSVINFKTTSIVDRWMNDEVVLYITSSVGEFELSKDIWDFVFITADKNQDGLKTLDKLLFESGRFEKIDVDFEKYKLKE